MSRYVPSIIILGMIVGCAAPPVKRVSLPVMPGISSVKMEDLRQEVVKTAQSLLGTPYQYGGSTPEGFDCSGFSNYVYSTAAGKKLPRVSHDMVKLGRAVSADKLKPADIVYFKIENQESLHVVIYIGDGQFIHAPKSKGEVNIQSMDRAYWKIRYLGARRIL